MMAREDIVASSFLTTAPDIVAEHDFSPFSSGAHAALNVTAICIALILMQDIDNDDVDVYHDGIAM